MAICYRPGRATSTATGTSPPTSSRSRAGWGPGDGERSLIERPARQIRRPADDDLQFGRGFVWPQEVGGQPGMSFEQDERRILVRAHQDQFWETHTRCPGSGQLPEAIVRDAEDRHPFPDTARGLGREARAARELDPVAIVDVAHQGEFLPPDQHPLPAHIVWETVEYRAILAVATKLAEQFA